MSANIWSSIPLVTTPLTLVAFLAAALAWGTITRLQRAEKLIEQAPEKDRKILIEGALDIFKFDTSKLTSEDSFSVAIQLIDTKRLRLKIAFAMFVVATLFMAVVSVYAMRERFQTRPSEAVRTLLSVEHADATRTELRKHGIYGVDDRELPGALAGLTALSEREMAASIEAKLAMLSKKISEKPALVELRERAQRRAAPFQDVGEVVRVGLPEERDQPQRFMLQVPISSPYAHKTLRVTELSSARYLILRGNPSIHDLVRKVDIQLNADQAAFLFKGGFRGHDGTERLLIEVQPYDRPLVDVPCRNGRGVSRQSAALCRLPETVAEHEIRLAN